MQLQSDYLDCSGRFASIYEARPPFVVGLLGLEDAVIERIKFYFKQLAAWVSVKSIIHKSVTV